MAKYSIVEFADGMQMVPISWLEEGENICLWPNYTNQIKINKAISQLEVPCTLAWSRQTVLRTLGTAKTHEEGIFKLNLAEKLSDVDTAASDAEKLSGKRGRHLRAKRYISSDDDDVAGHPPPPKKKLPAFPSMPKNFRSPNSTATQRPDQEPEEGYFPENLEDECTNSTATSTPMRSVDYTGLSGSFRKATTSFSGNAVYEAKKKHFSKSIGQSTPFNIVEKPQYDESNKSQAAVVEFSQNRIKQKIDNGSQEAETPLEILKAIMKKLIKISSRLHSIEDKIDDRNDKNLTDVDDEHWIREDNDFPLKSQKALEKFEVALRDKTYLSKMVQHMKTIGGSAANTITVNVLKYTLSDLVALSYSWSGARQKKPFKDLNICKMLIKTVRCVSNSTTNDEIGSVVSKWLAQAKLRYTRSIKRSERGNISEETSNSGNNTEKDAPDE